MAHARACGLVALPAMLIFLVGCTAHDVHATNASGYLADAADQVAAADWSKAEMIEIDMSEFSFAPDRLHFSKGQPYRLHLVNTGFEPHTFTSEPFFKAIAVQKLTSDVQDVASPRLKSIGVAAGEAKDLYFVAVTSGTYLFDCSEPLHHTFGMTGTILVN